MHELLFTFFFLFLNFSSFLYSLVYWYTCKYYNYYFTLNDDGFPFSILCTSLILGFVESTSINTGTHNILFYFLILTEILLIIHNYIRLVCSMHFFIFENFFKYEYLLIYFLYINIYIYIYTNIHVSCVYCLVFSISFHIITSYLSFFLYIYNFALKN